MSETRPSRRIEPDYRRAQFYALVRAGYGVEDIEKKMKVPQDLGRQIIAEMREDRTLDFDPPLFGHPTLEVGPDGIVRRIPLPSIPSFSDDDSGGAP